MKTNQNSKGVYITADDVHSVCHQPIEQKFNEHFRGFAPVTFDEEYSAYYLQITKDELQDFFPMIISFADQIGYKRLWWEILVAETGAKFFIDEFRNGEGRITLKYLAQDEMEELIELFNEKRLAVTLIA